jgi:hypothetical protein
MEGVGDVTLSGGGTTLALATAPSVTSAEAVLAPNTINALSLDASSGDARFALEHVIQTQGPDPEILFESRLQTVTVMDTRFPERWERPDPAGTIQYPLSPHAKDVEWELSGDNVLLHDRGRPPVSFTADLPLGDYVLSVHYHDLWHPEGSPRDFTPIYTNLLHIVDVHVAEEDYALPVAAPGRLFIPLDMARSSDVAMDWKIEPQSTGGARLHAAQLGGAGAFTASAAGGIWVSAGTNTANYTVTATYPHPRAAHIKDTATLHVFDIMVDGTDDFSPDLKETMDDASELAHPRKRGDG